jgi:hypothetical protein
MISSDDFKKQSFIQKYKIDNIKKSNKIPSYFKGNLYFDDANKKKKITILTPEMKINKYNKFSLDEKYGERNCLYIKITEDEGLQQLLKDVLLPIDELMADNNTKSLLFPDKDINKVQYFKIISENSKIHFKLYDMKLSVIDKNQEVFKCLINNNVNDINKYLNYNSTIKMILDIDSVWVSQNNIGRYGVKIICREFLILNGNVPESNLQEAYKLTSDYNVINNRKEKEEEKIEF